MTVRLLNMTAVLAEKCGVIVERTNARSGRLVEGDSTEAVERHSISEFRPL